MAILLAEQKQGVFLSVSLLDDFQLTEQKTMAKEDNPDSSA